tara:strand:- start:1506 stop:1973 length:468 start_codon:yes stop_codon:yes gene_type:complete
MKQLFLLRHGEAGFSQGSDFQRQLTQKGRENMIRMGKSLLDKVKSVDLMYCSSSQRTMETADLAGRHIIIKENVFTRDIYEGDMGAMISILEKTSSSVDSCLFVGHNPTISLLLSHITGENYLGLEPGMMAIVELEISDWQMIGFETGILKEIIQ